MWAFKTYTPDYSLSRISSSIRWSPKTYQIRFYTKYKLNRLVSWSMVIFVLSLRLKSKRCLLISSYWFSRDKWKKLKLSKKKKKHSLISNLNQRLIKSRKRSPARNSKTFFRTLKICWSQQETIKKMNFTSVIPQEQLTTTRINNRLKCIWNTKISWSTKLNNSSKNWMKKQRNLRMKSYKCVLSVHRLIATMFHPREDKVLKETIPEWMTISSIFQND